MSQLRPENALEVGGDASFYLDRIRQIDKIMEGPVRTLIELAEEGQEKGKMIDSAAEQLLYFPTWKSKGIEPQENKDYLLTQAICCGTLQRIWRLQRRFSWLDKKSKQQLENVREALVKSFTPKKPGDFDQCATLLYNETFGGLNPLTSSQVFRVLLNAGEDYAHSGIGFLAFFAMIWPLYRKFPNPLTIGARIEPWDVTAYVTAKCLLPIGTLQGIISRRAELFDDMADNLKELGKYADGTNARDRWLFNTELDDLYTNLFHVARYAIDRNAFIECAKEVQKLSDNRDGELDNPTIYSRVLCHTITAFKKVKTKAEAVLSEAENIVSQIEERILRLLRADDKVFAEKQLATEPLRLRLAKEHLENPKYWDDLVQAVEASIEVCSKALSELAVARTIDLEPRSSEKNERSAREEAITTALKRLAAANRNVSSVLEDPVKNAALWCRGVVDREIAHASAENVTDFDPCELVSGIAVAVRWNLMTTPLQVSDAVKKAIAGARSDGSWRSGKPFYSPNHAFGVWAMTSDIVWTLTSAIEKFPQVREADEKLFDFVNWLERTRITLPTCRPCVGWASERLREREKIHLATTALSINALLEGRDLAEYRLWQLCGKRFSVISIEKLLKEIDPVDLGAAHPKRLHRRLANMAQLAERNSTEAEYSLVLHGPPGSSKTKVAEALSAEMWKFFSGWGSKEPRLIRITPADFTRMGEDRLDSEARAIFDLISGVRAVTVFFDEIDDLLRQRNRSNERPTFMDLVVPAMLNRLADLRAACPRQEISFLLATNYVENIDSALIRKGRIDASIPVVYPDFESRKAIITREVAQRAPEKAREELSKFVDSSRCVEIARRMPGWPHSAITSLCGFLAKELQDTKERETAFKDILERAISAHESSFAMPGYEKRWKVERHSSELLNEYWHHLISQMEEPTQWKEHFERDKGICDSIRKLFSATNASNTPEALDKLLRTILEDEGRLPLSASA